MVKQNNRLAIVIPAYKRKYLKETLDSLKSQTNQAFSLYIGDDNSPEDLWEVIKEFTTDLQIEYKKFDSNWGGKDLVSHWNRCLDLVKNEDWIWLFSDDDCMDTNCVESFYECVNKNPSKKLLHFNVKVIDNNSEEIKSYESLNNFTPNMTAVAFFKAKIQGEIQSYVIEYVFHKSLIDQYGKFVNFDLAWCSDDATWIKFAQATGITTIQGAFVKWRLSGINISSIKSDLNILKRKLEAKYNYFIWIKSIFVEYPVANSLIIKWLLLDLEENRELGIIQKSILAFQYIKKLLGMTYGMLSSFLVFQKETRIRLSFLRKTLLGYNK